MSDQFEQAYEDVVVELKAALDASRNRAEVQSFVDTVNSLSGHSARILEEES